MGVYKVSHKAHKVAEASIQKHLEIIRGLEEKTKEIEVLEAKARNATKRIQELATIRVRIRKGYTKLKKD